MSQNRLIALCFSMAIVLVLQNTRTDAACNVCNANGISCINETSFNLCQNGNPQTGEIFTCPSNRLCSDTSAMCVEAKAETPPTCVPAVTSCGVCDDQKLFTCTSRTTFAQCDGATVTTITGQCSGGFVCDSRGGELCKNACTRPTELECDIDASVQN